MAIRNTHIWRVEIVVGRDAVEPFALALESVTDTVSWFLADPDDDDGPWRLEAISRKPVDRGQLESALAVAGLAADATPPVPVVERLSDTDWVSANLLSFPPIRAGRFFVHGSHFAARPPGGSRPILIDAGAAFGSGEHATTNGCLLAIDRLRRRRFFARPLDLGCGTGILAIALAKSGAARIQAADIDPVSVRVAADNARRNGVAPRLRTAVSDGLSARALARRRPYDLIVANILARPLVRMAPDMARFLAPEGVIVLSGLLTRQERMVLAAYRLQGFSLDARIVISGWTTLILSRSPRRS